MKSLYPPIEPYVVHHIAVDNGHTLYVEECGNPDGIPVVYLHGGPGSGCRETHRRFFDPARFRAILLDQRGAGRSTPSGELNANTTQHLLDDLETLRQQLQIERWLLFGGSWGATLALLYAQQYPKRTLGMVLRGSFLARPCDLEWFLDQGAARIYPEAWQQFLDFFPADKRHDPVSHLYELLINGDQSTQYRAAKVWLLWGCQVTLGNHFNPALLSVLLMSDQTHKARIELHYAAHRFFMADKRLLDECHILAQIPVILIHGRNDLVCPPEVAFALHQALPHSELTILPDAGHISEGDTMIHALVDAADRMADQLNR